MSYSFEESETHDVKISDVKPLEKRINVVFKVVEKNDEREINKRSGETHRVCDFQVADETGSIVLTLWNEDIDQMELDSVYKLTNGFANVFQNSLRLSKGKYGSITDDSTSLDEVNEENNRSSEHVEDPRRRSYDNRRSYGGGGSGGGGGYGGGRGRSYRDRDRSNRGSDQRRRW
ncbi:MAG: single-stranded DNA-binding protein [Candidatus Hodarchaeota archaeon]